MSGWRHRVATGAAVGGVSGVLLVGTAGAVPRTVQVTLLGGSTFAMTLDVPPGTPASAIRVPGIKLPVLSVVEIETPSISVLGQSESVPDDEEPPAPAAGAPSATGQPLGADPRPRSTTGARSRRAASGADAAGSTGVRRTAHRARRKVTRSTPTGGAPTPRNPTYAYAVPGAAPVGVPNFFIDRFRVPPFLLPIYQAAGTQYGVRWEILAAINEIETDYGRNLNVSTAGAQGWMQFMPSTWEVYGVDANGDGISDPYNPVDAIFAAARYLKASGAERNIGEAIFAYNHADWYVDSVLMRARLIGGAPAELIGSLTGLTQGRFPVAATSTYARGRRATNIFARAGADVVAVQDGKVIEVGRSRRLGRFIVLRDVYGNTYTYAKLARVATTYLVPERRLRKLRLPAHNASPAMATSAGKQDADPPTAISATGTKAAARITSLQGRAAAPVIAKARLYAHPPSSRLAAQAAALSVGTSQRLKAGAHVPGGTVLGRIGSRADGTAAHLRFMIRPVGKGAPYIDPKPILDGWKLLESTAIYRARRTNPLFGPDAASPRVGQILLMTKRQLQRRVLRNPGIEIYPAGRVDIKTGRVDRRVLATLEFLTARGLRPTVSSLKSGHGRLTASGNVSDHSSGNAVDIAAVNGILILGHQGAGSIADIAIRELLTLQGTVEPRQIISLMTYSGTRSTLALPDHDDHIHIGFNPDVSTALAPLQWTRLVARLGQIDNPVLDRRRDHP